MLARPRSIRVDRQVPEPKAQRLGKGAYWSNLAIRGEERVAPGSNTAQKHTEPAFAQVSDTPPQNYDV